MGRLISLAGLLAILCGPAAYADVSEDEVAALREQIRMLTERLDAIEASNRETAAAVQQANQAAVAQMDATIDQKVDVAVAEQVGERIDDVSWAERIRWSGDFRYRYESIDVEDTSSRDRNRIRARASMVAKVSDTMKVGLGLASGGDDPVSTNQTLGGGGSTKGLNLDLAYFDWTGLADTHVFAGKFKNQLHRTGGNGLLWDGDWRPEGMSFKWDNGSFFAAGTGTWVESDGRKSNQEFSWGLQGGFNVPLGDSAKLMAGAGYVQIDAAGKNAFFEDGEFFGNSFDPVTNTYLYDFEEIEVFAELGFNLFDKPTKLFVDWVQNQDPDDYNTGYAFGFKFGKAKGAGTWDIGYVYQDLEADAVFGLLTDSDFGGGGTDSKGSVFKGTYAFHDAWSFKVTYFLNEIDVRSGNPKDFDRLMLDLAFKYK